MSRSEFEALRSQLAAVLAATTADSQVLGREQPLGEAVCRGGGKGRQLARRIEGIEWQLTDVSTPPCFSDSPPSPVSTRPLPSSAV